MKRLTIHLLVLCMAGLTISLTACTAKNGSGSETAHFYDRGTGMHSMYIGEIVNVWEK